MKTPEMNRAGTRGRSGRAMVSGKGFALALLAGLIVSASLSAPAAAGEAGGPRLQGSVGSAYRLWWVTTSEGESRIEEHDAPVDLSFLPRAGLIVGAGTDLVYVHTAGAVGWQSSTEPGELRFSLETRWLSDRLRLSASYAKALLNPLSAAESEPIPETLENSVLQFPWVRSDTGSRLQVGLAGQPLRRNWWSMQCAASYEFRGAYDLFQDGPRFDPGGRLRLAAGMRAVQRVLTHDLVLTTDLTGKDRLEGDRVYREGAAWQLLARSLWRPGSRRTYGAEFEAAQRASGIVDSGAALAAERLRGGSLISAGLFVRQPFGPVAAELSLREWSLRSLSGDLGHANCFEPGLAFSAPVASGRLGAALQVPWGSVRAGRSLHGLAFSWSWSGGIL